MKANELMVDDWVLWKGKPVQVASVSGLKYSFGQIDVTLAHCNDEKLLETHDISSIQPIPLTPKILEKNGFIIKKKWAQIGNFGNSPLIVWHFEDDLILHDFKHELEIHQNDTGKVHVKIPCEYVHELQHALKLCGIDKTIEL